MKPHITVIYEELVATYEQTAMRVLQELDISVPESMAVCSQAHEATGRCAI
jgi:hypothetical protein